MTTPRRGLLFHFTHVDNLPAIVTAGLVCDRSATARDLVSIDIGQQDVKSRRRQRAVPISPGGMVADYVPFYFAARSPMLYVIHKGDVSSYEGGQDGLVYLLTHVDKIVEMGLPFVFTDRNAAATYAKFSTRIDKLNDFVDWPLMEARYWNSTFADPDRMSRRMAEFLVHRRVPWDAFIEVAARTTEDAARAQARLAKVTVDLVTRVRQDWYF